MGARAQALRFLDEARCTEPDNSELCLVKARINLVCPPPARCSLRPYLLLHSPAAPARSLACLLVRTHAHATDGWAEQAMRSDTHAAVRLLHTAQGHIRVATMFALEELVGAARTRAQRGRHALLCSALL